MRNKDLHASLLTGQSNMSRLPLPFYTRVVNGEIGTNHTVFTKHAIGGMQIKMWDEGLDGRIYKTLIGKFKDAVGGRDLATIHVIWKQCGADVFKHKVGSYLQSFERVYNQFQRDLGQDFFLVIGQLNNFLATSEWKEMMDINRQIAALYPRTTLVETHDVDGGSQPLHHTRVGYMELGRRFGNVALNNILGDDNE